MNPMERMRRILVAAILLLGHHTHSFPATSVSCIAPSPVVTEHGAYLVETLDLRTAAPELIREAAICHVQGFYRQPGGLLEDVSDVDLTPLEATKFDAIMTRFGPDDRGTPAALQAAMVTIRDQETQTLVGCCSLVGCIKVRDARGARLLSGREAEALLREGEAASAADELALVATGFSTKPRRVSLLSDLAVLPQARRRGLARQMCDICDDLARSWDLPEIVLLVNEENEPARELYRSLGFSEDGTRSEGFEEMPGAAAKQTVTNLLMSKWLRGAPRAFKLGASSRAEEKLRKQWIGHVIPAAITAAALRDLYVPPLMGLMGGGG